MTTVHCDVLIVGASLGGVAAAMRAAEMGADVHLIEAGEWIGGQLTSQGVCTPDENLWIELGGGTASYRAFRERIRQHYGQFRLSAEGRAQEELNPGSCWVSRISMEPKVAQRVLREALDILPTLTLNLNRTVTEIAISGDSISAVETYDLDSRKPFRYEPSFVLDATELGDLLPMAAVEHSLGAESEAETGEPA